MESAAHVVIFPYDEHGHTTPALALGRALASRGLRVTLALTATRFAHCMRLMPASSDSAPLSFAAIPDNTAPDGGAAKHSDHDVCFQHSLQKLEPGLEGLLLQMQPPPSCLISDLLYPWSPDLADRLRLPYFHFCVVSATTFLIGFHSPLLISGGFLPFQPGTEDKLLDAIPGLPREFRLGDIPVELHGQGHRELEVISRIQRVLKRAAGIVINSTYELESDVLDTLSAEGFSMYAVGPISGMALKESHDHMSYSIMEDDGCLHWLDHQPQGAVVYVAFGSLVSLTEEEIQEVALGLEACGQPFLWVLRPSRDSSLDPMSALPAGFEERTKERGCLIAWAPQAAVLAHAAVGCFLTHCGWGSSMEALWEGVPLIGGFCKVSDQNTCLRLLTREFGLAMALQDPNVSASPLPLRCAVETCVKEMMQGERGRALSEKALEWKGVVRKAVEPNGSSYRSLHRLVDELQRPRVWERCG